MVGGGMTTCRCRRRDSAAWVVDTQAVPYDNCGDNTCGPDSFGWWRQGVHTKFEFDFVTTATPDQVIELMTDFSPNRPHRWPASSVKAFEVYHLGDTDADIREGQDFPKLWATWHTTGPHPTRSR